MNAVIAGHFEQQAQACDAMGSPFTARVCRTALQLLDSSTRTGGRILAWPGDPRADALALRLCGALHALVLCGDDDRLAAVYPPASANDGKLAIELEAAIRRRDDWICAYLKSAPQTNEIARSAALLPGFLQIARDTMLPLALNEIGSSAGLNLFPDCYRYKYGEQRWGTNDFPTVLAPVIGGKLPDLTGKLTIARRTGADIAPIRLSNPEDLLRLRSYIWPDQPERLARLDAAIAVAQGGACSLVTQDARDFIVERLSARKSGEVFVLFHSVVWQYLHETTKSAITSAMEQAGRQATPDNPLAWLRMEGLGGVEPDAGLHLTLWPGGETRLLARADFHARWIEWL